MYNSPFLVDSFSGGPVLTSSNYSETIGDDGFRINISVLELINSYVEVVDLNHK